MASKPHIAYKSWFRITAWNAVLAAVYFIAAYLGLTFAYEHKLISLVWAPSGIAIAAVLLLGYGILPGVFIGAFLINFIFGKTKCWKIFPMTRNT